jgi:hypothetical protein
MAPTINGLWRKEVQGQGQEGRAHGLNRKVNVKNLHVRNAAIFSPDDSRKSVTVSRSRYGNDVCYFACFSCSTSKVVCLFCLFH